MKIISKCQAMTLYRQQPGSRLFRFSTGKYKWSGSICHYAGREVEDIRGVLAARWRTYAAFWPCLLNVVRTAMVPMSFFEALLSINPLL